MAGAVAGISILGSGLAMADATAFVAGGGGRAHYDSSSNVLTVFNSDCADNRPVAGVWKWDSSPTQRAIVDFVCEDGTPARRTLNPPAAATNIRIQACKVRSDGALVSCGAWQTTHK
jgi:hypothetical protein